MSHLKRRRTSDDATVDMTPMLDIVFIMLIFFIVTAVFLDEKGLDFTKLSDGGVPSKESTIQIFVDEKDRVSVDRVPVRLSGVSARVERLLSDKPNANILFMASHKATLDPIVNIRDKMNQSGRPTVLKIIEE